MKKKILFFSSLFVFSALCYSQENTALQNIFINGGYRINGGEGVASIGYESPVIWENISIYTSVNFVDRKASILNTLLKEKDYFAEEELRKRSMLSQKFVHLSVLEHLRVNDIVLKPKIFQLKMMGCMEVVLLLG